MDVPGGNVIYAAAGLGVWDFNPPPGLVADRIIQLGGTPVINPNEWTKLARCSYDEPSDSYIEVILEQNLKGERCAIQRY